MTTDRRLKFTFAASSTLKPNNNKACKARCESQPHLIRILWYLQGLTYKFSCVQEEVLNQLQVPSLNAEKVTRDSWKCHMTHIFFNIQEGYILQSDK